MGRTVAAMAVDNDLFISWLPRLAADEQSSRVACRQRRLVGSAPEVPNDPATGHAITESSAR